MRLTLQTDFALRVLLYAAARPGQWVSSQRMADLYGASPHHISKVAKDLVTRGYLQGRRGNAGGFRLAVDPAVVRIGRLVQELEPTMDLLACFDAQADACLLSPACGFRHALMAAQRAFLTTLDRYSLADLSTQASAVLGVFEARERALGVTAGEPSESA